MEFLQKYSGLVDSLPDPLTNLSDICPESWNQNHDEFKTAVSILERLSSDRFSYSVKIPYASLSESPISFDRLLECGKFLLLPQDLLERITETMEILSSGKLPASRWNTTAQGEWDSLNTRCWACVGDLDGMMNARQNGSPWDELTTWKAAANGHLDCLKYAHENGCPWHPWTAEEGGGHQDCINYALKNGCPWSPNRHDAWLIRMAYLYPGWGP